jgi:hypothetical protein
MSIAFDWMVFQTLNSDIPTLINKEVGSFLFSVKRSYAIHDISNVKPGLAVMPVEWITQPQTPTPLFAKSSATTPPEDELDWIYEFDIKLQEQLQNHEKKRRPTVSSNTNSSFGDEKSNIKEGVESFKRKTIVAVLGLFNRGKTHVLNQLAGIKLPSSKKPHTKGLSFMDPSHLQWILLDTAGTNAPLGRVQNDEEKALVQKRATEMFTQELAFAFADIIVVVVNELTWPDQGNKRFCNSK